MQRVEKPWGYELIWARTERYVGKMLHVNAGESLSLQYHERKEETILLQSGHLELTLGTEILTLLPGDQAHIPTGTVHRMSAVAACDIIEVSTPELDDVVRLEDRYGRVEPVEEKKIAA
jgi:mannose-6-phosphate isomerase-like protein (cupin superfamily)